MINRCRLYLQVISIMDLLTYNCSMIHPSYKKGQRPPLRISTYFWPLYSKRPCQYWKLWSHFLQFLVTPLLQHTSFSWDSHSSPNNHIVLFYHPILNRLFKKSLSEVSFFKPVIRWRRLSTSMFINVEYISENPPNFSNMILMDAEYTKDGIHLVSESSINSHVGANVHYPMLLLCRFHALDPALQRLCGDVAFPLDDGASLFSNIKSNGNVIFGSSNASVKHQSSAHAWTITSGLIDELLDPLLCVSG
jgi:hypothetical protein